MNRLPENAVPQEIRLNADGDTLILCYAEQSHELAAEYLRVYSPSAEVRGHGQAVLQTGKCGVRITALLPAGHYALKIVFSDGHDSGLYDWAYLYRLASQQDALWADYLQRLAQAGASRVSTHRVAHQAQPDMLP